MAQTYSEFKTYLSNMLWRQNDTVLSNNLDKLIRMADSELNRKLNIGRRNVAATIAPETEDYALPADFYQIKSLSNLQHDKQRDEMRASSYALIQNMRAATSSTHIAPYYYVDRTAAGSTLYLVGPFSASNPGSFAIQYRTTVPDFQTDDSSWLEAEYLDLYVYAVFKHCAIFLREDERIRLYTDMLNDALGSAVDEDLREVQFGGTPLNMQPHHHVPRTKRKF